MSRFALTSRKSRKSRQRRWRPVVRNVRPVPATHSKRSTLPRRHTTSPTTYRRTMLVRSIAARRNEDLRTNQWLVPDDQVPPPGFRRGGFRLRGAS